jgi:hypothetical protein
VEAPGYAGPSSAPEGGGVDGALRGAHDRARSALAAKSDAFI